MAQKQEKAYRRALEDLEIKRIQSIEKLINLNARAVACHCECLGLNAENMLSAINNTEPIFGQKYYSEIMQKWGLINGKGEPLI